MSKKTFYTILITIAGLLIIGGLIWYFMFRTQLPPSSSNDAQTNFTVPGTAQGNLKAISNSPVIFAYYDTDKILYYDFSGQLWQFGASDAKPTAVNQTPVKNIVEVIWAKNQKQIIKTGTGQSDINYFFSDQNKKSLVNLKSNIKSLAFSPDFKKTVYQISDNLKTNSLFTSDPDGKNQKTLINTLKLRDVNLYWPSANQIILVAKPSSLVSGSAWILDIRSLGFAKILDNFLGLAIFPSPDGKSFIYSYVDQNGKNPVLAVSVNGVSSNTNISTLSEKCVWLSDSINVFCAVPQSWPDSMVLPDDYYKKTGLTNDAIWKINTKTGEKDLIFSGLGDINNLIADSGENNFYFILGSNQFLYRLSLK